MRGGRGGARAERDGEQGVGAARRGGGWVRAAAEA